MHNFVNTNLDASETIMGGSNRLCDVSKNVIHIGMINLQCYQG